MKFHELMMSKHESLILDYFEIWLKNPAAVPTEVDILLREAALTQDLQARLPQVQFLRDLKRRLEAVYQP